MRVTSTILLLLSLLGSTLAGETIYTPTDWRLPPLDFAPAGNIQVPKQSATLNVERRFGGKIDRVAGKELHITTGARAFTKVMGDPPDPKAASGPCINLGTQGSNRTGIWCSSDINCVVFYDEQCRYKVNEKKMPSVVLQPPGIDYLNYGWWQEKSGLFLDYKIDGFVPGPKSARCMWRKAQRGMDMDPSKETM